MNVRIKVDNYRRTFLVVAVKSGDDRTHEVVEFDFVVVVISEFSDGQRIYAVGVLSFDDVHRVESFGQFNHKLLFYQLTLEHSLSIRPEISHIRIVTAYQSIRDCDSYLVGV